MWLPLLGFVLNMGYRLQLVRRMQQGERLWPGWNNWSCLLRQGSVATAAIVFYNIPVLLCIGLAAVFWSWRLLVLSLVIGLFVTFFIPGFMTFYAHDQNLAHVISPWLAWGRVVAGGWIYVRAWGIVCCACFLSFLGLAVFGIGFAWTSVWFWQVAAFCFSRVFSEQYKLRMTTTRENPV